MAPSTKLEVLFGKKKITKTTRDWKGENRIFFFFYKYKKQGYRIDNERGFYVYPRQNIREE